jgi:hypothetical protein
MTAVVVKLPDQLAMRAKSAGLLSDSATQRLPEGAIRRQAGRSLLRVAEQLHAEGAEPMTDEAIVAEVTAARAERRERKAQRWDPAPPTKGY